MDEKIKEIREDLKRYQINTDFEPSNNMYCHQIEFLLSEYERLEKELNREITYRDALEQAEARVKELGEGIKRHKNILTTYDSETSKFGDNWDYELYKLIEEKP